MDLGAFSDGCSDVPWRRWSAGGWLDVPIRCTLSGGRYQARWDGTLADGRSLGSGVYILRLRVGGDSHTRKVMILR